jgi:OmpA-OmpF porin, OOP family
MRRQASGPCKAGFFVAVLIGLAAAPIAARAQSAAPTDETAAKLAAVENPPEIDVNELRQTAAARIKSKADNTALKRPPVAPQLMKLPRLGLDIRFDEDTAIIRPESYGMMGRVADVLLRPALLQDRFLIIGRVASTGRREINLTLSQRRADSVRDVLINTFKIPAKRLQSVGLGEEQFLDSGRPTAPVNQQVEVANLGVLPPEAAASPHAAAAPSKSAKAKKKR